MFKSQRVTSGSFPSQRTNSENISLGPTGRTTVAWAQGSSGGGSSRFALPAESESRQGNRFSALSGGDSGGSRLDSKGRAGQRRYFYIHVLRKLEQTY